MTLAETADVTITIVVDNYSYSLPDERSCWMLERRRCHWSITYLAWA